MATRRSADRRRGVRFGHRVAAASPSQPSRSRRSSAAAAAAALNALTRSPSSQTDGERRQQLPHRNILTTRCELGSARRGSGRTAWRQVLRAARVIAAQLG
eukprot:349706-Chlamydomonas_euryale.AAC.4